MSTVDPSRASGRFGEIATSQPSGLAAVFFHGGNYTLYICRLAYMQCRKQCVNQFVIGNHLLSRAKSFNMLFCKLYGSGCRMTSVFIGSLECSWFLIRILAFPTVPHIFPTFCLSCMMPRSKECMEQACFSFHFHRKLLKTQGPIGLYCILVSYNQTFGILKVSNEKSSI